jgi:beta-lactamase regulating signal transducer with metallopeptidase domain
MSLTASFVIAVVLLARFFLRRAPKIISYALWAVVLFNLLCPFKPESAFSLIPFGAEPIDVRQAIVPGQELSFIESAMYATQPWGEDVYIPINPEVVDISEAPYNGNAMSYLFGYQAYIIFGGNYLWPFGAAALLLYAVIGYIRLKRRVSLAVRVGCNIYETDMIKSPFVLGLFRPRIYIPTGMDAAFLTHIIEHERTHIKRRDYLVSVIAFAALALHWFNPLVWVAYMLMLRDMESSCDEAVLRHSSEDIRRGYSSALLGFSSNRRQLSFPLAFGEQGVKERVKRVLNFKKPSRVIIVAAVALVAVLSVGFAVNRASETLNTSNWETYDFPVENYNQVFFRCNDTPYNPEYISISAQLMNNQNVQGLTCGEPFTLVKQVGDTWKVVPFADGIGFDDIAFFVENGMSFGYTIRPEMLSIKLDEGNYRIVTNVWYPTDRTPVLGGELSANSPAFYNTSVHTVWADFTIDNNTPRQEIHHTPDEWFGNFDGKEMTLDDVRELAAKGDDLLFEDLRQYKGGNVSSNLSRYIMVYGIEGGYRLVVHSNPTGKPDTVYLESIWENGGSGIDIRYEDVDVFLRNTPSQEAITEEQALEILIVWARSDPAPALEPLGTSLEPGESCWAFNNLDVAGLGQHLAVGKRSGVIYLGSVQMDGGVDWRKASSVFNTAPKAKMTLDDVRGLAVKGETITDADLEPYQIDEVPPTGIYHAAYLLNDGAYRLSFSVSVEWGLYLARSEDLAKGNRGIDIRYYNVDKYIKDGTRELVRPLPEPKPDETPQGPAPSVRVTIEEWNGGADQALELIFEDDYYEYYLSSIRSDRIMLTFESGERVSLKDALAQGKINMEDLMLNGLQFYKELKDGSADILNLPPAPGELPVHYEQARDVALSYYYSSGDSVFTCQPLFDQNLYESYVDPAKVKDYLFAFGIRLATDTPDDDSPPPRIIVLTCAADGKWEVIYTGLRR